MLALLATAGGFGGTFEARPDEVALASDALPKLIAIGVLVALLVLWAWSRWRSLTR